MFGLKKVRLVSKTLAVLPVALSFAACQNYTSQPICNDGNSVLPAGMTGTYTFSIQHEDFTTETQQFTIEYSAATKTAHWLTAAGDDSESRICQVGGQLVSEEKDDTTGFYQQDRLYVTGMGLSFQPLFYDKAALDDAGVTYKIFEVPQGAAKILGKRVTTFAEIWLNRAASLVDEPTLGLVVANDRISSDAVMSYAKAGPIGLTFLRQ